MVLRDATGGPAAEGAADLLVTAGVVAAVPTAAKEGTISDGCVTCPWPGGTFRFADGSIVRSPASMREPSYQTRIQNGRLQVRAFT
jgi:nitrite reductase/ring-hydroxylating ferredoxin subunit